MILGGGPHGTADFSAIDQQPQNNDQKGSDGKQQNLKNGYLRACHLESLLVDGGYGPVFSTKKNVRKVPDDDRKADGDEQRRHMSGRAQRPERHFLHQIPQDPSNGHSQYQGNIPGKMPDRQGEIAGKSPRHVDFAVGKRDQVHGTENDDETNGDEGVYASLGKTVYELRHEHPTT